MADEKLRQASIRTLAWLGDAHYERAVRWALARRGDYAVTRLDDARARVVRAEAQASLLEEISPALNDAERAVVRRASNAQVSGRGRAQRDTRAYRAATGLEALVGWWACADADPQDRFDEVLRPSLERAVDAALAASARPRRG